MRDGMKCLVCGGLAWLLIGCGSSQGPAQQPEAGTEAPAQADSTAEGEQSASAAATAQLQPTEGHQTSGRLTFESAEGGVRVTGTIEGLTPGAKHGFHIHEVGDCSAPDASSAGGHYSPQEHPHGHPDKSEHHLGDLENLQANDAGQANVDQTVTGATLGDGTPQDLVGKAVVVHLAEDDYETQPSGGSGARIACGVIEQGGM